VVRVAKKVAGAVWDWAGRADDYGGRLLVIASVLFVMGGGGLVLLRSFGLVNTLLAIVGVLAILLGGFFLAAYIANAREASRISAGSSLPAPAPEAREPQPPDLEIEGKWTGSIGIGESYHIYPTGGHLIEQWFRITNRSISPSRSASVSVTVYGLTNEGEMPRQALTPFAEVPAHEKWREWPVDIEPGRSVSGIWAYHWPAKIGVLTVPGGEERDLTLRSHRAEITDHVSGKTAPIEVNGTTTKLRWN
jgi:hypothetical protein